MAHSLLRAGTLTLGLLLALLCVAPPAPAQTTVQGVPLMLPDGRLCIFGAAGDRVVVLRVASVGADRPPLLDLQPGDVILRFQGVDDPDSAAFQAALAGAGEGATLRFDVRRGEAVRRLEFPKPSPRFLIPQGAGAGGGKAAAGGGWTRAPEPGAGGGEGPQPKGAEDPAEAVQHLLADAVAAAGPGMTLAVWRDGEPPVVAARGLASLELSAPLTPGSILPVDSVAKQFTAFAIALLVTQGELSLEDDVRRLLPELSELPEAVTVRQMLTHTSGLKDYTGLLALTGWEHGDGLSSAELLTLVGRQRALDFPPGSTHRYSNTNYALLPLIVERLTGVPFQEWMHREVFAPLGMEATSFPASSRTILPGGASLYRPTDDGFEGAHGGHGLAGAGGLMSTSPDLMRWARELVSGELGGEAVRALMRQKAVLADGTEIDYGLGLGVGEFRGVPRLAHSGSGPASASVLHVYPEDGLAIAVLANYGDAEVYALAVRIAEVYLGERLGPEAEREGGFPPGAFMITEEHMRGEGAPPGAPIDAAEVAAFAGRYVLEEDELELMLEAEGSTLLLKLDHSIPGVPLVYLGNGRFLYPPAGWELSFDRSARPAQSMTLHLIAGSVHRGEDRDVAGHRSEVRELTAADRRALLGSYLSPELGVVYRILERDGTLFLEHPRLGQLPLTHHSGDAFGLPGRKIRRVIFLREDAADPTSAILGMTAEAYAWSATARFDRISR